MTRIFAAVLVAAVTLFATPALAQSSPASSGASASYFKKQTPLRYHMVELPFSTTANLVAQVAGVVPPGGAILKDVILLQAAAGVGGTSWVATPKTNGVSFMTTPGGFTVAAGANKATNAAGSPFGAMANPTGGTRPVLDLTKVSLSGGESITVDITLTGTYSTAVTGSVLLVFEPKR
jgi:hypothetical protein